MLSVKTESSKRVISLLLSFVLVVTSLGVPISSPGSADAASADEVSLGTQQKTQGEDAASSTTDDSSTNGSDLESEEGASKEDTSEESADENSTDQNSEEGEGVESESDETLSNTETDAQDETATETPAVGTRAAIAPLSASGNIYWNPTELPIKDPADDTIIAPAGDDLNTGADARYPVLTWSRVQELYKKTSGATIIVMTTAVLGTSMQDGSKEIVPLDFSINGVESSTDYDITFTYWNSSPEELFLIPNTEDGSTAGTLTLANVKLMGDSSIGAMRIVGGYGAAGGQLKIGTKVSVSGLIQTDLDEWGKSRNGHEIFNPILLTEAPSAGTKYTVYYSGINHNINYSTINVITTNNPSIDDIKPYFELSSLNTAYEWSLIWDNEGTSEEGGSLDKRTLELYREYQYDAVYLSGKGNDSSFGGNCSFPVKTFARAKEILRNSNLEGDGIIYICDTVNVEDSESWSLPASEGFSANSKVMVCPDPDEQHSGSNDGSTVLTSTLVAVKSGASLETSDITIQMATSQTTTNQIVSVEAGGTYTINSGTLLTGKDSSVEQGVGVKVQGSATATTTLNMNGGTIQYRTQGVQIVGTAGAVDKTIFNMSSGAITKNDQTSTGSPYAGLQGAGIHANNVTMTISGDASINNNIVRETTGVTNGRGGGMYVIGASSVSMSGGGISTNRTYLASNDASQGGGVYLGGSSTFDFSGGSIKDNISSNSATTNYGYGGGMYITSTAQLTMSGTAEFNGNKTGWYGGGIYTNSSKDLLINGGSFTNNRSYSYGSAIVNVSSKTNITKALVSGNTGGYAAFYVSNLNISGATKDDVQFTNNSGSSGAAIYFYGGTNTISGATISGNTGTSGGGINNAAGTTTVGPSVDIKNNTASNGGALYQSGGTLIVNDGAAVSGNTVTGLGAGIYTSAGTFCLNGGSFTDNLSSGSGKGTTAYLSGTSQLLKGSFVTTNSASAKLDSINFAISTASTNKAYIDPNQITFTNNNVYLQTVASRLYLLNTPDPSLSMPISVNKDAFEVGSIVASPAGSQTIQGTPYSVSDVSPYPANFKDGVIPAKTTLGGFEKNIILVGQGVYIDGANGDDSRMGTDPSDAVKTYARAKELLRKYIGDANTAKGLGVVGTEDTWTFEPYIYVCGQVTVTTPEAWSLDYATDLTLKQDAQSYSTDWFPQMLRFASYYGTMALVTGPTGTLDISNLTINGMAEAVNPTSTTAVTAAANGVDAILDGTAGGILTLDTGAKIINNFQYGIRMNNSSLIMQGVSLVKGHRYHGVILTGSAQAEMKDTSVVSTEFTTTTVVSDRAAVYASGTSASLTSRITMGGQSKIYAQGYRGISLAANSRAVVGTGADTSTSYPEIIVTSGYGIYSMASVTESTVQGYAQIRSSNSSRGGTGYYSISSAAGTGSKLTVSDDAQIRHLSYGIDYYSGYNLGVTFKDRAQISDTGYGVTTLSAGYYNTASSMTLSFEDESGISSSNVGIYFGALSSTSYGKHQITFSGEAKITGSSTYGYWDKGTGTNLTLKDNSSITDSTNHNVYIYGDNNTSYINRGSLTMTENASIKGSKQSGIYLGESRVAYPITYDITLSGQATIRNNTNQGVYLNNTSTLSLAAGTSVVSNATSLVGNSIYAAGAVTLDVGAEVDNEIYMASSSNIITLTDTTGMGASSVTAGKFNLGYAYNFIGQRIIGPSTSVADARQYMEAFVTTANIPDGFGIIEGEGTNENYIVVLGNNNVYLAGTATSSGSGVAAGGSDSNNGASPGSPVRTFAKAKEILATREPGANIIICNYTVQPIVGDYNWSFDAGGNFTNNAGQTWQPIIERYENYSDYLVSLSTTTTLFNNLTFDGNKNNVTSSNSLIYAGASSRGEFNNVTLRNATTSGYYGSLFYSDQATSNVVFNGGVFTGSNSTTTSGTASLIVNLGTLVLNGTEISKNQSTLNIPMISNTGTLTVKGSASITENSMNTTSNIYGGIISNSGSLSISGSSISNNTITTTAGYLYGGLVRSTNRATTITDTIITGNKVTSYYTVYGGLLYVQGSGGAAELTVSGTSRIENNTVTTMNTSSTFPIYGGVLYTEASSYGAKTSLAGTIKDNTASGPNNLKLVYGVVAYSTGATATTTIAGAAIDNNTTTSTSSYGGALYVASGSGIMTDGSVTNNKANAGSAIYLASGGSLTIAAGTISGNTPVSSSLTPEKKNAPLYIDSSTFILKGGRPVITDHIYLTNANNVITLAGSIYQNNRSYTVDVPTSSSDAANYFKKGSVVVKPDGDVLRTATPYYRFFNVIAPGYVLAKQAPNLILKTYVFIDSTTTLEDAQRNGATPDTPFKSFAEARAKITASGNDLTYCMIFVSGPMIITGDETWSLEDSRVNGDLTSSVTRYAGFALTGTHYPAYTGDLITVKDGAKFTLENIEINGRRDIDTVEGGTLVKVEKGGTFNLGTGATLTMNTNPVSGTGDDRNTTAGLGGAIYNEGTTNVAAGATISETSAEKGSAIYQSGTLNMLTGASSVSGTVYLPGTKVDKDDTAGINYEVNAEENYAPSKKLSIVIENPYNGREVVEYPDSYTPTVTDAAFYLLEADVASLFKLGNRAGETNVLELQQKGVVYIDGVDGDDARDGMTPETSVATLKRAYELLKDAEAHDPNGVGGGVIIVVNQVSTSEDISLVNNSSANTSTYNSGASDEVRTNGTVYIRRYAQPIAHETLTGYNVASYQGVLLSAESASLTLQGITVDGHSRDFVGTEPFTADGVEAQEALVVVKNGATLIGNYAQFVYNNNGALEGQGGGLRIEDGGTASLRNCTTSDNEAAKGSGIYQGGTLNLAGGVMALSGQVYLAGNGNELLPGSSRSIYVTENGTKNADDSPLDIVIQDPYRTRTVVTYTTGFTPGATERAQYKLESEVLAIYSLKNRVGETNVLELQYISAVYIDGVDGDDANSGLTADSAVKTLSRAYKVAEQEESSVLYVVNTVTIDGASGITKRTYTVGEETEDPETTLTVNDLEIRRYSKPGGGFFRADLPGFTHASNVNALFSVTNEVFTVADITIDGHRYENKGDHVREEMSAGAVEAESPLIAVSGNGGLQLRTGALLRNNNNVSTDFYGGAINNTSTVRFDDAVLSNNYSERGSGIYHDGARFALETVTQASFAGQTIYLASHNTGTAEIPNWTDRTISVTDTIDSAISGANALSVELDHAQRGRNIAVFDPGTFDTTVANEREHFSLGGVPSNLGMEASLTENNTIELQDWVNVQVKKVWNKPTSVTQPSKIVFELQNTDPLGDAVTKTVTVTKSGDTLTCSDGTATINQDGSWSIEAHHVSGYESASNYEDRINYKVVETSIDDVVVADSGYLTTVTGSAVDGFTLRNAYELNITYDANGGTGDVPASVSLGYGDKFIVSGNTGATPLSKGDYVFGGWSTEANGGTIYSAGAEVQPEQDLTLYAVWLETFSYKVNYYKDSVTDPSDATNYLGSQSGNDVFIEGHSLTTGEIAADLGAGWLDVYMPTGYVSGVPQNTPFTMTNVNGDNVINVLYEKNSNLNITVEYYSDNLDATSKIQEVTLTGFTFDEIVSDTQIDLELFRPTGYQSGVLQDTDVRVREDGSTVVRVLYEIRTDLVYNVEYYDLGRLINKSDGTTTQPDTPRLIARDSVGGQTFGSEVWLTYDQINKYKPSASYDDGIWSPDSVVITVDTSRNVFTVTYIERVTEPDPSDPSDPSDPADPSDPTPLPTGGSGSGSSAAQTSDTLFPLVFVLLGIVVIAGISLFVLRKKIR